MGKDLKRGIRLAQKRVRKHKMNDKLGNCRYSWDWCCWFEMSKKARECKWCPEKRYWLKGEAALDYEYYEYYGYRYS